MRWVAVALLVASCRGERAPARIAADYAAAPKDHYDDLSRMSQRWLGMVFEEEKLPEVPGAACTAIETRADRVRFRCANAGAERTVVLVREDEKWRVAETSRAFRLLAKAKE